MIVIKDEDIECTSETINNNNCEVKATNSENVVIKLDKLKLVPSTQNAANLSFQPFFLAEGETEIVKNYCGDQDQDIEQNC